MLSCSDSLLFDETTKPVLKSAEIPIPNITGTLDLFFSPTSPTNIWNGTIEFGDGEYSIALFTLTPPRDYSQVYLFDEEFIIYESGTNWQDPDNVVLKGSHKGRLVYANKVPQPIKFSGNGMITVAKTPFEQCLGRTYHFKGTVFFASQAPPYAKGVLRIN